MSFSGSISQRKFGFELDSKTIRRIFFRKHSAVNQVFVEVVELANSSSPAVLDAMSKIPPIISIPQGEAEKHVLEALRIIKESRVI